MAVYLVDSSSIVKHYVRELGSNWVSHLMDPAQGHDLYASRISAVEVVAALARRARGGTFSAGRAARLTAQFRREFDSFFDSLEVTRDLINQATDLAEKHALRGYDAVQLAAALEVNAQSLQIGATCTLVSADTELNAAAVAEGLAVDDPNSHP